MSKSKHYVLQVVLQKENEDESFKYLRKTQYGWKIVKKLDRATIFSKKKVADVEAHEFAHSSFETIGKDDCVIPENGMMLICVSAVKFKSTKIWYAVNKDAVGRSSGKPIDADKPLPFSLYVIKATCHFRRKFGGGDWLMMLPGHENDDEELEFKTRIEEVDDIDLATHFPHKEEAIEWAKKLAEIYEPFARPMTFSVQEALDDNLKPTGDFYYNTSRKEQLQNQ